MTTSNAWQLLTSLHCTVWKMTTCPASHSRSRSRTSQLLQRHIILKSTAFQWVTQVQLLMSHSRSKLIQVCDVECFFVVSEGQ